MVVLVVVVEIPAMVATVAALAERITETSSMLFLAIAEAQV